MIGRKPFRKRTAARRHIDNSAVAAAAHAAHERCAKQERSTDIDPPRLVERGKIDRRRIAARINARAIDQDIYLDAVFIEQRAATLDGFRVGYVERVVRDLQPLYAELCLGAAPV